MESLDNGKPVGDSDFDIGMAVDTLRYFAGWADKIHGDTIPVGKMLRYTSNIVKLKRRNTLNINVSFANIDGNYMSMTIREPVGVAGAIIPWNYPILMAVGNSSVCST